MKYDFTNDLDKIIALTDGKAKGIGDAEFLKLFWLLSLEINEGVISFSNRLDKIMGDNPKYTDLLNKLNEKPLTEVINHLLNEKMNFEYFQKNFTIEPFLLREIIYRKQKISITFNPDTLELMGYWKGNLIKKESAKKIKNYGEIVQYIKKEIDKLFDYDQYKWEMEYRSTLKRLTEIEDPNQRITEAIIESKRLTKMLNKRWDTQTYNEKKEHAEFKALIEKAKKEATTYLNVKLKTGYFSTDNHVLFIEIMENGSVEINQMSKLRGDLRTYILPDIESAIKLIKEKYKNIVNADQQYMVKALFDEYGIKSTSQLAKEDHFLIGFSQDGINKIKEFGFKEEKIEEIYSKLNRIGLKINKIVKITQ